MTFENDKTLTFPTSGTLKNIQYSEAWVHVDGESVEEMKEAISRGDGELLNENAERTSLSDLGLGQR